MIEGYGYYNVLGTPQGKERSLDTPVTVETGSNRTRGTQLRRVNRTVRHESSTTVGPRM